MISQFPAIFIHVAKGMLTAPTAITTAAAKTSATTPTTTAITSVVPCVDNTFVKCEDTEVCSTDLKSFCPLSCGLCSKSFLL